MKKILVWGTGQVAGEFLENHCGGRVIGFIQSEKDRDSYIGKPVYRINELPTDYDYIVVANTFSNEIYDTCVTKEIDLDKVIFLKKYTERKGCTNDHVIKEILGERNYAIYCAEHGIHMEELLQKDRKRYDALNMRPNFKTDGRHMWPIIADKYKPAGTVGNYFWQDLWAARLICKSGVKEHLDIGSRLDGFIAHLLAAGIEVTMIDVREFPNGGIEGLHTIVDDATTLRQIPDESIGSMSALCSLEHFGLGRYGDPVDPEACFKCFGNIQKKLKRGGRLYLSVPVGRERVEFNAHRVFYASTITDCFRLLRLEEFSCASEGGIEHDVGLRKYDNDPHNGEYRYGLFSFVKDYY